MLVLTRKEREGLILAGNIRICVLEIHRGRVKIGISAPREVQILRHELTERHHEDAGNG
jgi:carbon storage regulator